MTKKKSIFQRFARELETGDNHFDKDLRSRYYKSSFKRVYQGVIDMFNRLPDFEISSQSEDHGEISAYGKTGAKPFIVATVVQVRPMETSVDFKLSTEQIHITGSYPKLRETALQLYQELDKNFQRVNQN